MQKLFCLNSIYLSIICVHVFPRLLPISPVFAAKASKPALQAPKPLQKPSDLISSKPTEISADDVRKLVLIPTISNDENQNASSLNSKVNINFSKTEVSLKNQSDPATKAIKKKVKMKHGVAAPNGMPLMLQPLGELWKSTSGKLADGIRKFRENIKEGVLVASLLKEDMNEGVGRLRKGISLLASGSNEGKDSADINKNKSEAPISTDSLLGSVGRSGMMNGLLRFIGVDSSHIGVVALNVLIIFAEWIASSFLTTEESPNLVNSRMIRNNILEWISLGKNEQVDDILEEAGSPELPSHLISTLKDKTGDTTSCVQLLVCKMSPVIHSVQHSVNNTMIQGRAARSRLPSALSILSSAFQELPSLDNFVQLGDTCETKFPSCKLYDFGSFTKS